MIKTIIVICSALCLLASCTKYALYQSPMHNNTHIYKELPMYTDSSSSAFYGSGTFTATGANKLRDDYSAFHGSLHRAHQFSRLNAYYGVTGAIGNYSVKSINQGERPSAGSIFNFYNEGLNDSLITANSGNKSFRSFGVNGGINYVKPWPHGEWRILGAGFSFTKESGQYLEFREKLPDSAANMIDRQSTALTVAISTDFIAKTKRGNAGYQLAYVFNTRRIQGLTTRGSGEQYQSAYTTHTIHICQNRTTGYFQLGMGTYTLGMQLGASYRIGK